MQSRDGYLYLKINVLKEKYNLKALFYFLLFFSKKLIRLYLLLYFTYQMIELGKQLHSFKSS